LNKDTTAATKRRRLMPKALTCPHCGQEVDLVSTKDVVGILGVSTSTFQNFRERENFPEPLAVVGQGALWLRADIEKWHQEHQQQRVDQLVGDLDKRLGSLDPKTRGEVIKHLREGN